MRKYGRPPRVGGPQEKKAPTTRFFVRFWRQKSRSNRAKTKVEAPRSSGNAPRADHPAPANGAGCTRRHAVRVRVSIAGARGLPGARAKKKPFCLTVCVFLDERALWEESKEGGGRPGFTTGAHIFRRGVAAVGGLSRAVCWAPAVGFAGTVRLGWRSFSLKHIIFYFCFYFLGLPFYLRFLFRHCAGAVLV